MSKVRSRLFPALSALVLAALAPACGDGSVTCDNGVRYESCDDVEAARLAGAGSQDAATVEACWQRHCAMSTGEGEGETP